MTQPEPQGPETAALFSNGESVAMPLPKALADRYHLAEGAQVEIYPTDNGIFLRPIGVAAWFSIEWERALDAIVSVHGDALKAIDD